MKEVWLVTGVRGAGKSAVSRQLASHFERGVYISGDQLCDLIVTGQVDPDGKPADEAESQIELTQRNMCLLAQSFSDAGFVPVLDWVVRHQRDLSMFLQGLSGCTPYIVVLAPGLPTVAQRKPEAFRRWAHLEPELIQELSRIGLWVDTSDLGVEETVSHILATKAHAKMVPTDRKREENGYVSRVITRDEFNKRLVELCLKSGLTGFPRKFRDRHILLRSVALTLGAAREYTESELDDRLTFWLTDRLRSRLTTSDAC